MQWGVSVDSLLRRCKEVGVVSEATYRRAHQRLATLRTSGLFVHESVQGIRARYQRYSGRLSKWPRQTG